MRQLKISKNITSRESKSLSIYLAEVSRTSKVLTPAEELALATKAANGDKKAFNDLVQANLRFVISVAKQYQSSGVPLEDLVNEGNMGLILAAQRFDHTKGFKFISYAVWWIRQSITSYLNESSRTIRLPSNRVTSLSKIKKVMAAFEQEFQREPTTEEIHDRLEKEVSLYDIAELLNVDQKISSLDMPLSEDSSSVLSDLVESDGHMVILNFIKNEDLKITLSGLINKLNPIEQTVLIQCFGLNGQEVKSMEEVSKELNLTKERIRQIKERSIRRIKARIRSTEIEKEKEIKKKTNTMRYTDRNQYINSKEKTDMMEYTDMREYI